MGSLHRNREHLSRRAACSPLVHNADVTALGQPGSGDGWVTLDSGRVVWGRYGAAGMLLCHRDGGTDRVLLARRAHWVHGGNGEWSVPGGAIDAHEQPVEAALREFDEEIGAVPAGWRLAGIHEVVVQPGLWSYHTCCALVDERPHYDATLSPENDEAAWWTLDELDELALFRPFAEALPSLLQILARAR